MLIVITEFVFQALDLNGDVRVLALNISKAFSRVWHTELLDKFKGYALPLSGIVTFLGVKLF